MLERPLARRGPVRLLRAAVLAAVSVAALLAFAGVANAAPRTFYVDCTGGNDNSAGTGTGSLAWKTLVKANAATLAPGDSLLLKRSCSWTGPLNAKWSGTASSPITIDAYGTGNAPVIQNAHDNVQITGSYLVLQNLYTRADPQQYDPSCGNAPAGWRVGFRFYSGATYNTLRYSTATGLYNGIRIEQGSHHNKIIGDHLIKNNVKDEHRRLGRGRRGHRSMGDDNEISGNDISGSDQCSPLYGRDGSAIEVYGGKRNVIHHNTAVDNNNFVELGNSRSSDTTIAYNKVYSSLKIANFLVTRGPGDTSYGPVYNTKAYNNSVYLTGASSYAVMCLKTCSASILSLRNNIIVSQGYVAFADGPLDEGNNIYWQPQGNPKVYLTMSSTSRKIDPRWVNPGAQDFHLERGQPGDRHRLDGRLQPGLPDGSLRRGGAARRRTGHRSLRALRDRLGGHGPAGPAQATRRPRPAEAHSAATAAMASSTATTSPYFCWMSKRLAS